MKKFLAMLLVLCMVLSLAACGGKTEPSVTTAPENTAPESKEPDVTPGASEPENTEPTEPEVVVEPAMTYAEYMAAELYSPVIIECYVQDTQSWWNDTIKVYAADEDGAYFIYNMTCSEEDSARLVPGTKIRVTGEKGEYAGEVEVAEGATFEILEGSYIAPFVDVTALLGTEAMIDHMNQSVSFTGLVVEPSIDPEGNEVAFLYNWDGSGSDGSDLYFNVSYNGKIYNFTVESYLRGAGTEVYEAVKNLQVGDVVDLSGYCYWYNGLNPHIISCTVTDNVNAKSEGVMTYAEYMAAEEYSFVTVECYVQATQSWYNDSIIVYAADGEGAYFLYKMVCSQEDAAKLVPGTKIKATGEKANYAGEIELGEFCTFEFEDGYYIAPAVDVTALLGSENIADYMNRTVTFSGMVIEASLDASDNEAAFVYNWDGSGDRGSDLYFKVSDGKPEYTFYSDLTSTQYAAFTAGNEPLYFSLTANNPWLAETLGVESVSFIEYMGGADVAVVAQLKELMGGAEYVEVSDEVYDVLNNIVTEWNATWQVEDPTIYIPFFCYVVTGEPTVYTFTVESYLCDENSEVYQAVEALQVGDVVDLVGFLYWYNGVNPHITGCVVK